MAINKSVATIIILIINLILIFLFVIPKYQESNDLQISLIKKQAEYDSQSEYYIKLLNTIKTVEDRQDILEKINSGLPSDIALAPVVYFLQKKSAESQLIIKSLTFSGSDAQIPKLSGSKAQTTSQTIKNIIFTADISGSYQGLKSFIYSLEKSARLFQVNNISFTPSESLFDQNYSALDQIKSYDFKLEIKTYTY